MIRRGLNWWWALSFVMAIGMLVLAAARPGAAQATATQQAALDTSVPQRFTAMAANLSNVDIGPAAQTVQIEITRWSTDGERDRLLSVLKEKGEKQLLSELQKLPRVGYIRTPNSIGYDLHFARQRPFGDGGRQIFIATDRYINYWEVANQARTLDYPFTLIQLQMKANGEGEGKLSVATKVITDGADIILEDYASQPVQLTKVTREK